MATLSNLSESRRRDRFVRMIAEQVLASCESRKAAGATELREVLSAA